MAEHDRHCNTRTLRKLELPARMCEHPGAELRRALYVDCETTGFSTERDEIIEIAMLPFTYAIDDERVVEVLHDEALVCRNDPGRPLDPAISALTGLTDDDLDGQYIDVEAACDLVSSCHLVIAHNAPLRPPVLRAGPSGDARRPLRLRASDATARTSVRVENHTRPVRESGRGPESCRTTRSDYSMGGRCHHSS